jgi:hypothetical protein
MHEGKAMAGEGAVIEWAPFRLREGVTESELLEASNAIQRNFLDGRPGFLRRELARSDDGLWSDVVQWSDAAAAAAAMEAAGSSETCHRYFHLMTGSNGNADPGEGVILMRLVRAYPRDAAP